MLRQAVFRAMPLSRAIISGIVASAIILLGSILVFFQTKDPMILAFSVQVILAIWVVVLIVHVLRHGIPVRIVDDERRER